METSKWNFKTLQQQHAMMEYWLCQTKCDVAWKRLEGKDLSDLKVCRRKFKAFKDEKEATKVLRLLLWNHLEMQVQLEIFNGRKANVTMRMRKANNAIVANLETMLMFVFASKKPGTEELKKKLSWAEDVRPSAEYTDALPPPKEPTKKPSKKTTIASTTVAPTKRHPVAGGRILRSSNAPPPPTGRGAKVLETFHTAPLLAQVTDNERRAAVPDAITVPENLARALLEEEHSQRPRLSSKETREEPPPPVTALGGSGLFESSDEDSNSEAQKAGAAKRKEAPWRRDSEAEKSRYNLKK